MRKLYATCPECEHQHHIRFLKWFFAPNMYSLWVRVLHPSGCGPEYWRWLRCPVCKKRSWTPLEDEIFVEGRRLINENSQNMYASFQTLINYLSEHRDEIIEELNNKKIKQNNIYKEDVCDSVDRSNYRGDIYVSIEKQRR